MAEASQQDLQGRAAVGVVEQVHLVGHHAAELVEPVAALAQQAIRLLAGADQDVQVREPGAGTVQIPHGQRDPDAKRPGQLLQLPVLLAGQRSKRHDVDALLAGHGLLEQGDHGDERLAAGRRHSAHDRVALGGHGRGLDLARVELVEALGLEALQDPRVQRQVCDAH